MISLDNLFKNIQVKAIIGNEQIFVSGFSTQSLLAKGKLFICVGKDDNSINLAIENGAKSVLVEKLPNNLLTGITYIVINDIKEVFPILASNLYYNPSHKLIIVGVTGTNGKTTTTNFLFQVFTKLGYTSSGINSTVSTKIGCTNYKLEDNFSPHTRKNKYLREILKSGGEHCFMELTSIAIENEFFKGIHFSGAVFTNLTQDHLNYHGNMERYFQAKKKLFDNLPQKAFALVNVDDSYAEAILSNCQARKYTFSLQNSKADFYAQLVAESLEGIVLKIEDKKWQFPFQGKFNAYNLLGAYGAGVLLGEDKEKVLKALQTVELPQGRLQPINNDKGLYAFVDYAHTPDGLEKVLEAVNNFKSKDENKIIVITGCGGDKDKEKRPVMGKIAVTNSDIAIFTSDNPRNEDPMEIIKSMMVDLTAEEKQNIQIEPDRRKAIEKACKIANAGDIILVAGKGHEETQEINEEKLYFSDVQILSSILK